MVPAVLADEAGPFRRRRGGLLRVHASRRPRRPGSACPPRPWSGRRTRVSSVIRESPSRRSRRVTSSSEPLTNIALAFLQVDPRVALAVAARDPARLGRVDRRRALRLGEGLAVLRASIIRRPGWAIRSTAELAPSFVVNRDTPSPASGKACNVVANRRRRRRCPPTVPVELVDREAMPKPRFLPRGDWGVHIASSVSGLRMDFPARLRPGEQDAHDRPDRARWNTWRRKGPSRSGRLALRTCARRMSTCRPWRDRP